MEPISITAQSMQLPLVDEQVITAQRLVEMNSVPLLVSARNGVRSIRGLLFSLKTQGKTIILACYFAQEIDELCDAVCEMDRGVPVIHK